MASSLLFLVAGVLLKQTVDEVKTLCDRRTEALKAKRDAVARYNPPPLAKAGSPQAYHLEGEHRHRKAVEPQLAEIRKQITRTQLAPLTIYALLTAVAFALALCWSE
ncbi:MAG: hypothetical protein WD294_10995 [Phycisphaeraceae bacterium]